MEKRQNVETKNAFTYTRKYQQSKVQNHHCLSLTLLLEFQNNVVFEDNGAVTSSTTTTTTLNANAFFFLHFNEHEESEEEYE